MIYICNLIEFFMNKSIHDKYYFSFENSIKKIYLLYVNHSILMELKLSSNIQFSDFTLSNIRFNNI